MICTQNYTSSIHDTAAYWLKGKYILLGHFNLLASFLSQKDTCYLFGLNRSISWVINTSYKVIIDYIR